MQKLASSLSVAMDALSRMKWSNQIKRKSLNWLDLMDTRCSNDMGWKHVIHWFIEQRIIGSSKRSYDNQTIKLMKWFVPFHNRIQCQILWKREKNIKNCLRECKMERQISREREKNTEIMSFKDIFIVIPKKIHWVW